MTAPKVYAAICAVMEDIGKTGIAKDRKNQQQGYNFRGIDDVYNELNALLSKHRLLMLPSVVSGEREERQTKSGGALFYTRLTIDFKLVSADDGSSDTIRTVGEAMDSADKSSNKAQSAAYKYAAMMVFCIPTEGDNDADHQTHVPAPDAGLLSEAIEIAHDGFKGDIIGSYITREGKRGVVVQQNGTRVVHVYGEKWIAKVEAGSTRP